MVPVRCCDTKTRLYCRDESLRPGGPHSRLGIQGRVRPTGRLCHKENTLSGFGGRRVARCSMKHPGGAYRAGLCFALVAVLVAMTGAWAEEPALPAGLGEEEPALPAGLGGDEPSLPAGLGSEEPALPAGLGDETTTESAAEDSTRPGLRDRLALHGFWETRVGIRTQPDPAQSKDTPLAESRLQLETLRNWGPVELGAKADVYLDGVLEQAAFDLRQLQLTWSPLDNVDLRVGRQTLTWGTGDLIFINDLFPKDWQSFLSGRDEEYLKAPSDAIRVGLFTDWVNVNFVYTPQFDPDRFITGERISYFNPIKGRTSGSDEQADCNAPSTWFQDDEFALRLYRNVGAYELAIYAYSGYWKSPGGQRFPPMQVTFPKLNVYGASLRGTVGKGIGNIEVGYYDSRQDRGGYNVFVNNSEFRLLVGYEQELAKELTGGFQYYLEHMMDYDDYRDSLLFFMDPRDEDRHLFTARLTKLLMNQDLTVSLFAFYSPSDGDMYLRPKATYKVNDTWTMEGGANVFWGIARHSFFGQFEDNTNVYASVRASF